MQETKKQQLHEVAKRHVASVIQRVHDRQTERVEVIERLRRATKSSASANRLVDMKLLSVYQEEQEQFTELASSPYFVRCDVQFEGEMERKTIYFAKFPFTDEQIFSWTSPASVMRFESVGACAYRLPDKSEKRLELLRKDQFMIVGGKILFMSSESDGGTRELVYQEYFAQHKTDFALPEIVAQMEKAQDQVIRAAPHGSLLVSGPAGSGKTTLALHRVAFLAQSPDTAARFPSERMMVFVQDRGTQAYFSQLLPSLGIHHVEITTFDQWTMKMLALEGYRFVVRPGLNEVERDLYEYAKRQSLRRAHAVDPSLKDQASSRKKYNLLEPYEGLASFYASLGDSLRACWDRQRQHRELDRFDLCLLLFLRLQQGPLTKQVTLFDQRKNGNWKKRVVQDPIQYALILLDEVQNYLPEQIQALKTCLDPETKALLYVGDLAQQTRLGTMRDWSEVQEQFSEERKVVLQKVYRNTKQILEYVGRQGYAVSIPSGARIGQEVEERICSTREEIIQKIERVVSTHPRVSIGILLADPNHLSAYQAIPVLSDQVRLLSVQEAQGVEFDVVCVIREHDEGTGSFDLPDELQQERAHVARDVWYVALTRAMNELYVFYLKQA